MGQTEIAYFVALFGSLSAGAAHAQTYTVDSISPASIGTVAAATTGTTVFADNADTSTVYVYANNGNGAPIKGPYAFATVGVRCVDSGSNLCSNVNNVARIRVVPNGVVTGRANNITNTRAATGTGTIGAGTTNSGPNSDVQFSGWTASNQVLTFLLSLYLVVNGDDGAGSTGAATAQYNVYAGKYPTNPTSNVVGTMTATVQRSLTITKTSDLAFGTFTRPTSGTNYVVIGYKNNGRSQTDASGNVGAGTIAFVPSSFSRAVFLINGEPGSTFSLSVPASFSMTGPGPALTVQTSSYPPNGTITVQSGGSNTVGVGGTFPVSSTQASGNYTGSFVVTAAYN